MPTDAKARKLLTRSDIFCLLAPAETKCSIRVRKSWFRGKQECCFSHSAPPPCPTATLLYALVGSIWCKVFNSYKELLVAKERIKL